VRVAAALLAALLLVVVVSSVIFAPAVLATMSFVDVPYPTQDQVRLLIVEQAVVCASIAVNNKLLMVALKRAAERSGFLQKVNEDVVYAICAFSTTVLSSIAPLIIASVVASTESTTVTRPLSVQWLFQVLLLNMGVTEVGYFMSPAWSFWTSYFWIRQSRYVSVREGEPLVTAPEFPLASRYVSMLHNLTVVCVMIAIGGGKSLYVIAAQSLLLLYVTYAYFTDKYVLLRVTRQTHYTSPKLDAAMHYVFVAPAAALSIFPLQFIFDSTRPWLTPALLIGNVVIFLAIARLCQKCTEPRRELSDIPYVEVASLMPHNYFNTNPVHVLRCMHFPSIVVPPIYPHRPGKEYLQGGQFADYDDSVRLRETLMLLAKAPLKGMDDFGNPQDFS
jgi:hypothetical protein